MARSRNVSRADKIRQKGLELLARSREVLIAGRLEALIQASKRFQKASDREAEMRGKLHLTRLRITKKRNGVEDRLAAIDMIRKEINELEALETQQAKEHAEVIAELEKIKQELETKAKAEVASTDREALTQLPAT